MKVYTLPIEMVNALRSWFHPKDRSVILAPATFIEGEEIVTPAHPTAPANPAHNRGRLYWKDGCWTQLDENGVEQALCNGIWHDWSPVVTQSVNVTFTATYARYKVVGNDLRLEVRLSVTSAGVAANAIVISGLPYPVKNAASGDKGTYRVQDVGTTIYVGVTIATSTVNLAFASNTLGLVGGNPSFALASGDLISFNVMYEIA